MSGKRMHALRLAVATVGLVVASTALVSCSEGGAQETVRFTFSKREAIGFMTDLVADYNSSQDDVHVNLDTSGPEVVSASFVRGNPPDLMLANYNMDVKRFVERCALSDLSDTDAAASIRPDLQPLMDQYGVCPGQKSALPYSIMSAGVIYNKEIFAEHDLEVPTTWSELIDVCDTLEAAGVAPFYGTFKDDWTVSQGWFDYTAAGLVDSISFFDEITNLGTAVGPSSSASFEEDFAEPMARMARLAENYTNSDAGSRGYADGNVAFTRGEGAMYLQGPWAIAEIARIAPDLDVGTFPLPMTENADDRKVRVNVDLAVIIPRDARHPEAARDFLEYLYQPEIIAEYNASQLGFVPTADGPPNDDPRVAGMQEFYDAGQVYQGASVLVPNTIPVVNYAQAMVLGADPESTLRTLDADWARLALRQ